MRIVAISDTHNLHDCLEIPEGDVLIHAGDGTSRGSLPEIEKWANFLSFQPHKYKITISGNHDWGFQNHPQKAEKIMKNAGIIYLQDNSITLEGINFYGSPWQPWFYDWAFNLPRNSEELKEIWDKIPLNTDVLITHTPPFGILDKTEEEEIVGCELLREKVFKIKPKIHIFGHIHEDHGTLTRNGITFINASICTRMYRPTQKAVVVDVFSDQKEL